MIPRIIHHVWLGSKPLPERFARWRDELIAMHPGWEFWLWDDAKVAKLNCPQLFHHSTVKSSHSNMVRMEAVYRFGGVYVDCDFEPVKPLDDLLVHRAFIGRETKHSLCSAAFGTEPEHPWLRWQLMKLPSYAFLAPPWGPRLMTAAPREGLTILAQEVFYPWLWRVPLPKNPRSVVHPKTLLIHHWARSWQTAPWTHGAMTCEDAPVARR